MSLFNRLIFDGMALTFRVRDWLNPPGEVLAPVRIEAGMTVVDYGCGPGSYSLAAAHAVGPEGQVYGVDILPLAVEAVQRKAAREGLPYLHGVLVEGYATGLPAASADRVLLMDMIHSVPDRAALLREVHRLLKPDGLAYVDIHHTDPAPIKEQMVNSGLFEIVEDLGTKFLARPAL
jgi:ubiquinone/menaquinone biosynthesis C-methylase UbiE